MTLDSSKSVAYIYGTTLPSWLAWQVAQVHKLTEKRNNCPFYENKK